MSELQTEEDKKKRFDWIKAAVWSAVIIGFVQWIRPDLFFIAPMSFWRWDRPLAELLIACWPMLTWGAGITAFFAFKSRRNPLRKLTPGEIAVGGFWVSLRAGVLEEICFRWLIFLANIPVLLFMDYLFFGWLGFGLFEWVFHWIALVADFTTLGKLHDLLFHPSGWAVGAALLGANGTFRNGHRYQGLIGLVNSWFIGMYLFWIMFAFGLPAAILMHFGYDMLIFLVRAVERAIKGGKE